MLEDTRKRGATIAIYVIFGILIAVFVINFGPQSVGGGQGCKAGAQELQVTIGGQDYGMNTWRWVYNPQQRGTYEQRATWALDALVRRELLAQEAERRGLAIPESVIDDKIKLGEVWILGEQVDGKQIYFEDGEFFNYKMLMSNLVQRFGLTISSFKSEQRRELLAAAMEQILASGGHASKDEVFALWLHSQRTVTFDVVEFAPEDYRAKMVLTDADVTRYLAAHEAEVKAKYEADKGTQYTATVPKVRVRRVFVARQPPEEKKEEPPADPAKPADPAEKVELKPDPGQAKLEAARKDIVAKKKTIADVARALDSDELVRSKGGDLGWKLPDAHDLGDALLTEALKKLTPGGEPSPVIETPAGFYILAVEAKREGDLAFDAVKQEIAASLATDFYADEAAKRAALAALEEARTSKKKLEELYEKAEPRMPDLDPAEQRRQMQEQLRIMKEELADPDKSEEEKEQLRQIIQLIESGQLGMGPFEIESGDIPAAWEQAGGPSAGAPMVPDEPPAPKALEATGDTLPKVVGLAKPKVERIGPMPRDRERIVDVGKSAELMTALFESLKPGDLGDKVYVVKGEESTAVGDLTLAAGNNRYVIVQLVERPDADVAKFEEQAETLVRREEEDRGRELVKAWLVARCNDMVAKQEIKIATAILTTQDEEGKARTFQYGACGNL